MNLKPWRHALETLAVRAASAGLRRLSLEQAQALGRGLGRAAFRLGVARAAALENLALRLRLPPDQARRVAAAAYANFGQTMVELAWTPALDPSALDAMFEFEGLEPLLEARARGRGIVCMSAHYGNWEWMGAALIRRGFPVTFLIGTQSNPQVDALFNAMRARLGIRFIRIGAIREALRELKAGGLVALLGDQDGDRWGTFAPFFGEPASTHGIGELLARRSGAALAFGVPLRLGPRRHRLRVHLIPEAPAGLGEAQGSAWRLAEYNRLLEEAVRAHPEQWLWMHHRWRSIPLHRLSGADRGRAERGEIDFDMAAQAWKDAAGNPVQAEGWR